MPQRIATLSLGNFLRSKYLFHFSKPVADRALLKGIHEQPIRAIVEIGVGTGERTRKILEVTGWSAGDAPRKYTGIDLFEARPQGSKGMALKEAFNSLKTPNVKMQFVPGDPYQALARTANMLVGTDLLVLSADLDQDSLRRAWMYVPRMLHDKTLIYQQTPGVGTEPGPYQVLSRLDVERLAANGSKKQRKVA